MSIIQTDYMGDGVYACYDEFGGIWLHANDHKNPSDRVYIEGYVWDNLVSFKSRCDRSQCKSKLKEKKDAI